MIDMSCEKAISEFQLLQSSKAVKANVQFSPAQKSDLASSLRPCRIYSLGIKSRSPVAAPARLVNDGSWNARLPDERRQKNILIIDR
jgi:hypothetical protein